MLSFKNGVKLAEIEYTNKKKKSKIIYVKEDEGEKTEITNIKKDELLPKSFYTGIKNINSNGIMVLRKAIRDGNIGLLGKNENLKVHYNMGIDLIKDLEKKYFSISRDEGKISPIPMMESSRMAVFGPSGVGKSTFISAFFKKYLQFYPKNEIYIFSPKLDDPAYNKIKNIHYVKIEDSILEFPLDVSEFKNSICCFDDIESITDKRLNEAVRIFRNQCYEIGRAPSNITTIAVHHVILANEKTKIILNESDEVVLFPKSNFSQIKSLVSRYYGFGRDDINYIKDIPSRWVVVKRSYPTTIISENAVKVLS
jgi:GTPase SAR1 family protein